MGQVKFTKNGENNSAQIGEIKSIRFGENNIDIIMRSFFKSIKQWMIKSNSSLDRYNQYFLLKNISITPRILSSTDISPYLS